MHALPPHSAEDDPSFRCVTDNIPIPIDDDQWCGEFRGTD